MVAPGAGTEGQLGSATPSPLEAAVEFGSTFMVPASPATVFANLLDPEVMRECIPGCEELMRLAEEQYRGRMRSEIAHVRFDAGFSANVLECEAPTRLRAVLQGEDKKIASSIRIDANLELREKGPVTSLSYSLELALWGRVGRLGEAIVRRRSVEVQQQFEEAFVAHCRGDAVRASSLGTAEEPLARSVAERQPPPRPEPLARRSWWRRVLARLLGQR